MKNALIINTHLEYPFSKGELNATLVSKAEILLKEKGYEVKHTKIEEGLNAEKEVEKHLWADVVIVQGPVNWMGFPWTYKKYMDEIYSAGIAGQFCDGDGRTSSDPKKNYGAGGKLQDKKYMLSLTFNAPEEAFNNKDEYLFQGKSVDDLFFPQHMTFRFFGMQSLPTFVCYDVMKNPEIENDLNRFENHIKEFF